MKVNTHVAITKTVSEVLNKTDVQEKLPDVFPNIVMEGSEEELRILYPNAKIMSVEQYKGYHQAMSDLYEEAAIASQKTIWDKLKFW